MGKVSPPGLRSDMLTMPPKIILQPLKKVPKKTYSLSPNKKVYGFGVVGTVMSPVGGTYYLPSYAQLLEVVGEGRVCGLGENGEYLEEIVQTGSTENTFSRVLSAEGDLEILAGSALVAKTDRGAWRSSVWCTGPKAQTLSGIYVHTRGEMISLHLCLTSRETGKTTLLREFNLDMAQFSFPETFEIPPMTDAVWFAASPKSGSWVSVSYVIN